MTSDMAIDSTLLSLALNCAFVSPNTIAKEIPKSTRVTEYVRNFLQYVAQSLWPMFYQIISSGYGALLISRLNSSSPLLKENLLNSSLQRALTLPNNPD